MSTKPLTAEQRHHLATMLEQYVEQRADRDVDEGARNILHASFDVPVLLELLRGYKPAPDVERALVVHFAADSKTIDPRLKALMFRRLPAGPLPAANNKLDPELEALLAAVDDADAAATPGPWKYGKSSREFLSVDAVLPAGDKAARWIDGIDEQGNPERCTIAHPSSWSHGPAVRPQSEHDMRFIALARTALPALARVLRGSGER